MKARPNATKEAPAPVAMAMAMAMAAPTGTAAAALAAAALLLLGGGTAHAAKLMVPAPDAGADAAALKADEALRAALVKAGHTVVASKTGLDEAAAVLGCPVAQPACVRHIAESTGADFIVVARLDAGAGGGKAVHLTVYRGADGSTAGSTDVPVAAPGDAADYGAAIAPLLAAPAPPPLAPAPAPAPTETPAAHPAPGPHGAAAAATAPPAPSARGEVPGVILPVTWGVAGGAAALLVAGAIFGARTMALQNAFNDAPLDTSGDVRDAARIARRGKTSAALSGAFVGVGSVAAVAFALLVVDNLKLGLVIRVNYDYAGAAVAARF
ncbi:MAG TPA: hypothetical protein VG389_10885 [Myxococcota bacterium]|jgi:hypothetical protein|nr:hypothetical protein [Myxococcota bacterium]